MSRRIPRRDLLRAAGLAGLVGLSRAVAAASLAEQESALLQACRQFWASCPGARVLGAEYLISAGDRCHRDSLLEHLAVDLGATPPSPTMTEDEFRALMATRVRSDFAARRVVRLRGWLLSETEVRLCALAALEG